MGCGLKEYLLESYERWYLKLGWGKILEVQLPLFDKWGYINESWGKDTLV